ncbi:hypothetical protein D1P53_001031 [Cryptococcus gattii VGV]|nr:hypothetical protein D1P53_001031 [Cryptococcus gattii VGV]
MSFAILIIRPTVRLRDKQASRGGLSTKQQSVLAVTVMEDIASQQRHDSINRIIHRGLQSIEGAVVSLEPRTLEGQRRNDLRVRGRCGLHATDYDLKVYCLNDRDARSTTSAKPASTPLANHVLNRCLSWLDKISQNTTKKAPATHSGQFKAVVMSTGGLLSRETADEMRRWRKEMSPAVFEGMMRKISLELVRARARTFAM